MYRLHRTTLMAALLSVIMPLDVAFAVPLDELRLEARQLFASANAAAGYAALINFESEPRISASTLQIDSGLAQDDEISLLKLPIRHQFDLPGRSWKPFVQATLARMTFEQTYDTFENEQLNASYDSHSITVGGGASIPIAERWHLLPAIDAGYAYLSSDASYSGPLGDTFLKPVLKEIFFDWSADAWLGNGHLALQYLGPVGRIKLDANLSYTLSHIQSYRSTTELQSFRENINTVSLKLEATYPLGVSLWHYPLALVGNLGSSSFVGANRDALGFTYINEVGLSLQWDISRHNFPITAFSLGGMALWGDNVRGWSFLFAYNF